MNQVRPKRPRLWLDPEPYAQFKKQVLRRDSWRCQMCGSRHNLQVHHKQLRSRQGDEFNLITVCAPCHEGLHNGPN